MAASQSRAVQSSPAVAIKRPCRLNTALRFRIETRIDSRGCGCRNAEPTGLPSAVRQQRASAVQTVRSVCPSGLKETLVTSPGWGRGGNGMRPVTASQSGFTKRPFVVGAAGGDPTAVGAVGDVPDGVGMEHRFAERLSGRDVQRRAIAGLYRRSTRCDHPG